jgi:cobalt-zinc-cadmium efflux system outer membrane protein
VAESASSASRLPERAGADQGGAVLTVIAAGQVEAPSEPEGNLTVQQAVALALRFNPEVAAAAQAVLGSEGSVRQAGVRLNPELDVELEEFGGTDVRKGLGGAVATTRLSQPLDLGGKRLAREGVARSESRLVGWDYEAVRLDVLMRTKRAFVDVLVFQRQLSLADAALAVAEDVRKAAVEQVKAGKVSEIAETRASVEVLSAGITRDRARRELEVARRLLVANWGSGPARFAVAVGDLEATKDVGALDGFMAMLDRSPEVARWDDEVMAGRRAYALAGALRVPDVVVSAGVSRFGEDGSYAFVAGVAVPMPLFDRNSGGLAVAKHGLMAAEQKQRAARLHAAAALAEVHGRIENARAEVVAIRGGLLPAAQKAFDAAQAGYRQGKFALLEVLDAQRTLNEVAARQLDVLAEYHRAVVELERLTGLALGVFQ